MREVTADIVTLRVVAEVDDAQRRIAAYGANVERAFARVGAAAARGDLRVTRSTAAQGAAWRTLGQQLDGVAADAKRDLSPAEVRAGDSRMPADYPAAIDAGPTIKLPTEKDIAALREELFRLYGISIDLGKVEIDDVDRMKRVAEIAGALTKDLSNGLADAIANGKSLGDALVNAFARAGQVLIQSKLLQLLDGDGSAGFIKSATDGLGVIFGARTPARRASGGPVSAGQLYRVNEAGIEGFRPAGSGTIVPLGRMAARPGGGGVTVVQPLNVSFAGAITTPDLMAQFKAYADGVGQAAAIGGAAMAQSRMARRAARALPR